MMDRDRKGRDLLRLLMMLKDAELIGLSQATARLDPLRAEAAGIALESTRREAEIAAMEDPDPAFLAGADRLWRKRMERELQQVSGKEQEAAAEQERYRQRAAKALGRVQALDGALARQQARRKS